MLIYSKSVVLYDNKAPAVIGAIFLGVERRQIPKVRIDMDKKTFDKIKAWFIEYTKGFKQEDLIKLKYRHSFDVCRTSLKIARSLKFKPEQVNLSGAIGILHDVGRFGQYARYKTFYDFKSVDHAQFGVEVLKDTKAIDFLPTKERKIIIDSIKYHNKILLPKWPERDERLMYAQIIRDADKLDIYKLTLKNLSNPSKLEYSRGAINPKVLDCLQNGKQIKDKDIKSFSDFKIMALSWVYDLNCPYTFKQVLEQDYLYIIYSTIQHDDELEQIYKNILVYVNNHIKEQLCLKRN